MNNNDGNNDDDDDDDDFLEFFTAVCLRFSQRIPTVFHWCSWSRLIISLQLETSENTKYLLPFFLDYKKKRERDNFNTFEEHRATSPTET